MDLVTTPWTEVGFPWPVSRLARTGKRLLRHYQVNSDGQSKTSRHASRTNCTGQFLYWSKPDPPSYTELYSCMNGTNTGLALYTTEVNNIRTCSTRFDHSRHGFEVVQHPLPTTSEKLDVFNESSVAKHYWPDLVSMIKAHLGVRAVAVINYAVRQSSKAVTADSGSAKRRLVTNIDQGRFSTEPFHLVHNDCSATGARNLLRAVRPSLFEDLKSTTAVQPEDQETFFRLRSEVVNAEDDAVRVTASQSLSLWDGTRYQGPRWAIFSVWQPLETVESDPIGILDPTSMFTLPSTPAQKHRAYVSSGVDFTGRRGFADYRGDCVMPLLPQLGQHRWYWLHQQRPDEVLLIKLFDSEAWLEDSQVMPFAAHSAFSLPNQSDFKPRFSIETRVFVIW